jgi:hypothetical protein
VYFIVAVALKCGSDAGVRFLACFCTTLNLQEGKAEKIYKNKQTSSNHKTEN